MVYKSLFVEAVGIAIKCKYFLWVCWTNDFKFNYTVYYICGVFMNAVVMVVLAFLLLMDRSLDINTASHTAFLIVLSSAYYQ